MVHFIAVPLLRLLTSAQALLSDQLRTLRVCSGLLEQAFELLRKSSTYAVSAANPTNF